MGHQYTVQYKKGILNGAADALSRKPVDASPLMATTVLQPTWLDRVVASYSDDSSSKQIIQKLYMDPLAEPGYTFTSGLLRYRGALWLDQIMSCDS